MKELGELVQRVKVKEFIQFGDKLKEIVQQKIAEHPRIVQHRETVDRFTKQKEIYSQIGKSPEQKSEKEPEENQE